MVYEFSSDAGIEIDRHSENKAAMRAHLDSGVLARMVAKRWPDATNPAKIGRGWGVTESPDYKLVILGAWPWNLVRSYLTA